VGLLNRSARVIDNPQSNGFATTRADALRRAVASAEIVVFAQGKETFVRNGRAGTTGTEAGITRGANRYGRA
jgi:hypothetical protein